MLRTLCVSEEGGMASPGNTEPTLGPRAIPNPKGLGRGWHAVPRCHNSVTAWKAEMNAALPGLLRALIILSWEVKKGGQP